MITCPKYNVSCAHSSRKFSDSPIQEQGTIIQRSHQLSSTKGNCRSKHNQYATSDGPLKALDKASRKKRVATSRATDSTCRCSFHFTILYSRAHGAWFLKYEIGDEANSFMHLNHLPVSASHIACPKPQVPKHITKFIREAIDLYQTSAQILLSISKHFQVNVSDTLIQNVRMQQVHSVIEECGADPSGSAADRLISVFQHDEHQLDVC